MWPCSSTQSSDNCPEDSVHQEFTPATTRLSVHLVEPYFASPPGQHVADASLGDAPIPPCDVLVFHALIHHFMIAVKGKVTQTLPSNVIVHGERSITRPGERHHERRCHYVVGGGRHYWYSLQEDRIARSIISIPRSRARRAWAACTFAVIPCRRVIRKLHS